MEIRGAPEGTADSTTIDRNAAVRAYTDNRRRSQALFELLDDDTYYERPIPLRQPVAFYEGHIPAFSVICFLRRALNHPGIDPTLETLFARGIDPSDQSAAAKSAIDDWPTRAAVRAFADQADDTILNALAHAPIEGKAPPARYRGQGAFTALEHEVMHQETLLYMWHRFEPSRKTRPDHGDLQLSSGNSRRPAVAVDAGTVTLGAGVTDIAFGWDNEFPQHRVDVPAFEIDVHDVTNADFLAFVKAGGYTRAELWSPQGWRRRCASGRTHPLFWERDGDEWQWRGMFDRVALPGVWPVYVTHDEATAYARWRGSRLPTEAEFHRAAYTTPDGRERLQPWGDDEPTETRGNFDFAHWDPVPVGSYPAGVSAWGVHDLVGNGWEWTSTVFDGFSGFQPMASYPEYSQDFFDGDHFVVKGASPATGRSLIRRSFRNWFRPDYPYMYATFRCVRDAR